MSGDHPNFSTRDAAILLADEDDKGTHIQFRSGQHTLMAKAIEGRYPNYRNVIYSHMPESFTIPETHRAALIAWLWSLAGKSNSVRLA